MRKADNLTTIIAEYLENLGAQTSWNALGHTGPVPGLLLLFSMRDIVRAEVNAKSQWPPWESKPQGRKEMRRRVL